MASPALLTQYSPRLGEATVAEMCEKLLANTVIESYRIELVS